MPPYAAFHPDLCRLQKYGTLSGVSGLERLNLGNVTISESPVMVQTVVVTQPITTSTPSIRIQPSSFIPIQEMAKSSTGSTINITTQKQVRISLVKMNKI